MNLMKDPLDMVIYQQLFWNEKPRAIFEMGSYTGASAVWMADTVRSYALDCHVYSADIDIEMVDARARGDPNTTFIQGDLTQIENVFPLEMLKVGGCRGVAKGEGCGVHD